MANLRICCLRLLLSVLLMAHLCRSDAAEQIECDIAVLGGSTASLAAAITAAEAAPNLTVCFTEITDWPGGQMSAGSSSSQLFTFTLIIAPWAGGVPAIDFGGWNLKPDNQPASFRSFFNFFQGNPGHCTVSIKYDPARALC